MKSRLFSIIGILLAVASVVGLLFQMSYCWVLCPQALIVMFLRQSQHAFDSLGAADFPDLFMALLYWPLVSWFLMKADRTRHLWRSSFLLTLFHVLAIGGAVAAGSFRNSVWGFR